MHKCKKCQNSNYVKAGFVSGEQRYKCRFCSCQFVPTREKGMTAKQKALVICLYVHGLSYRTIAKIVGFQHSAIYQFIKKWATENYEKPEPANDPVIVLELDEMWHFIESKNKNLDMKSILS